MRTLGCLVKGCLSGIGVLLLALIILALWNSTEDAPGASLVATPPLDVAPDGLLDGAKSLFYSVDHNISSTWEFFIHDQ